MQLHSVANEYFSNVLKTCFTSDDQNTVHEEFKKAAAKFVGILGNQKFVTGDNLNLVDFMLFEFSEYGIKVMGDEWANSFPTLKAHHDRVGSLEAIAAF